MNDTLKKHITKFRPSSLLGISGTIALSSVLLFCIAQLGINANLNPQGIKLETLNREKIALVEENRKLDEEIAEGKSIAVVTQIANEKLDLVEKNPNQIMYISDTGLVAAAN